MKDYKKVNEEIEVPQGLVNQTKALMNQRVKPRGFIFKRVAFAVCCLFVFMFSIPLVHSFNAPKEIEKEFVFNYHDKEGELATFETGTTKTNDVVLFYETIDYKDAIVYFPFLTQINVSSELNYKDEQYGYIYNNETKQKEYGANLSLTYRNRLESKDSSEVINKEITLLVEDKRTPSCFGEMVNINKKQSIDLYETRIKEDEYVSAVFKDDQYRYQISFKNISKKDIQAFISSIL
ncbi:MAG: hypothetical protein RR345_05575 [Erysipelotrichaceae bacterium]